jgi:predicted alpha/beta hydrolase family esterase
MLDLIISYINFLILSISYLVKRFTFNPPDPPRYKIVQKEINNRKTKNEILFLVKSEIDDKLEYTKLEPKYLNIEFYKIKNNKESLPILIITPKYHISICILYCQGNSGDLGTSLFECYEISFKCNCIIVTFEYPGYGICKNEEICESEFNRRIKIVYNHIINDLNYKPNEIYLYGFSLGTGIAFDFACRKEYPIAGLILQSPFLSILRTQYDVKKTYYFDLFNNCDKAKKLCTKTIFIHSTEDKIVPYTHGRILAKLIPQKYFYNFLTINNAGHDDLLEKNKKKVFDFVYEFISYCNHNNNITINEYKNIDNNKYIGNIEINDDHLLKKIYENNNDIIKSEYIGFKASDNMSKNEKEQEFENTIKSNSYKNFPLNIKGKGLSKTYCYFDNTRNSKIHNNNTNNINREKQKVLNFSKNNYFVDINKNKKYGLYSSYVKIKDEKKEDTNDKTTENSTSSNIFCKKNNKIL